MQHNCTFDDLSINRDFDFRWSYFSRRLGYYKLRSRVLFGGPLNEESHTVLLASCELFCNTVIDVSLNSSPIELSLLKSKANPTYPMVLPEISTVPSVMPVKFASMVLRFTVGACQSIYIVSLCTHVGCYYCLQIQVLQNCRLHAHFWFR